MLRVVMLVRNLTIATDRKDLLAPPPDAPTQEIRTVPISGHGVQPRRFLRTQVVVIRMGWIGIMTGSPVRRYVENMD